MSLDELILILSREGVHALDKNYKIPRIDPWTDSRKKESVKIGAKNIELIDHINNRDRNEKE